MSNKQVKKDSKKPKKGKKEEEPAPDLVEKNGDFLMNLINEMREKIEDLKPKRNYVQNERDLIEQFSSNTKVEKDEIKTKITNLCTKGDQLEADHRVEVKVYLQKVKHLEYDQKLNQKQAEQEGEKDMTVEDQHHEQRLKELQKLKTEMKKEHVKNEDTNQQEIKLIEQHQKKTLKIMSDDFDKKIQVMENNYEEMLRKLKAELELKLKVEIHEIEERKNQHLNELMRNHDAAFSELKSYYNEITIENLNLIKAQKQRIEELQGSLIVNGKLITEIKAKNKAMEEPLERNRKLRDDLKYALRLHEKDKMALSNLYIKLKSLKEKISKTEREQDIIDRKYAKAIQDKKELETRFGKITGEVKSISGAKNVALTRKLDDLENRLDNKEAQLQHVVKAAQLDPMLVNNLTNKIQQSIEGKNTLIKNLQYSIHHATKAYNDAIRVYEAKLTEFGIPADELGFEVIQSKTSVMPAGLVSSQ